MKYRKRPIVIEAEQFHFDEKPWPEGVVLSPTSHPPSTGWIETLEGGHIVSEGDWIITGVKGERYPCKPDIFGMTYEVVVEGEGT